MSSAVALMQVLLGPGTSQDTARAALDEALLSQVEPLRWCASQLNLSETEIMARGAAWAGLTYFDVVPRVASAELAPNRLEVLGEVRLYRLRLLDREVAFAAPDFTGLLRLARARAGRPDMASSLCLVPESALRAFLVQQAHAALIDGARQTMARHWPHAAAQLELTAPTRYAFAVMMVALAVLTLLAPLTGQLALVPIWFALIMLPTVLRLLALASRPGPEPPASEAMDDADLPVYSVLVPLRDEANMVDQLCATLGRLDYPALCIKRTKLLVGSANDSTIADGAG